MKISAVALLSLFGSVYAGRPQLSISVRDGNFEGLDGLDPIVAWESSTEAGDIDLSYGVKAAVRPTRDLASLPRGIWGKAKADVSGWGVAARAELDGQDFSRADLEVDAGNEDVDLTMKLTANAGKDFSVRAFEATKGFEQGNGNRLTVTPRVDLENDERDVVLNYGNDKTSFKLTASADAQELTVSQQIDENNRLAPTLSSQGDISLEWERRLSDDSSLTANLRPNESLDVEWKDAAWTANINMPITGSSLSGANVSIK
jgi:hypothetical protein